MKSSPMLSSKNLIFDKIPSETAATLRNKQSEEKVKTWWAEVDGFDASANKFSVREALQKCSPTSFSKVKFTENMWKIKFHEHEDRDLFVHVLNRGVSFHGQRLKARNGVVRTPRRNCGKRLSGSLMPPTKITTRALCNKSGHLGLSEAFWRICTRPLQASRS